VTDVYREIAANRFIYETCIDSAVIVASIFLQVLHFTVDASFVQIYAHLLRICSAGVEKTWSVTRLMAFPEAYFPLSSMGRQRL
jgi:hypothetical protein